MHRPLSHDITGWIRVPMPLISPTYLLNEAPMMTCDISFPIVPAVKDYDPIHKSRTLSESQTYLTYSSKAPQDNVIKA